MSPQPSEIEVVPLTPADFGIAFLLGVLLLLVAVGLTAWAVRGPTEPEPARVEPVDDVERTVEVPAGLRSRRRARPPHTGTVHVPGVRPSVDDPTVVIRLPGGGQS